MSSKFILSPKTFTNIKIPWNITDEELQSAITGAIIFAFSACLYFFIFGKLIGRESFLRIIGFLKNASLAVWFTIFAGVIFCTAFISELHREHYIDFYPFDTRSYVRNTDEAVLVAAGFLVGIGYANAGGCTFGHGLTGIARLQKASVLAVIIFVTVAHLTVRFNLAQKIPQQYNQYFKFDLPKNISSQWYIHGCLVVPFLFFIIFKDKSVKGMVKYILNFIIGILFGLGMMVGGLTQRQKVIQSLDFNAKFWNPSMFIFYVITDVIVMIFLAVMIKKKVTPVFASQIQNPPQKISFRLIFGCICFGLGWGLAGLCPAPMYALIPLTNIKVPFYWCLSYLIGFRVGSIILAIGQKLFGKSQKSPKS